MLQRCRSSAMLTLETNIQTCENSHFDDRQNVEHNKTKIFTVELLNVLDICNRNDTQQHSTA